MAARAAWHVLRNRNIFPAAGTSHWSFDWRLHHWIHWLALGLLDSVCFRRRSDIGSCVCLSVDLQPAPLASKGRTSSEADRKGILHKCSYSAIEDETQKWTIAAGSHTGKATNHPADVAAASTHLRHAILRLGFLRFVMDFEIPLIGLRVRSASHCSGHWLHYCRPRTCSNHG